MEKNQLKIDREEAKCGDEEEFDLVLLKEGDEVKKNIGKVLKNG